MEKAELYSIDPATLDWQKSSYTGNQNQCVQLAQLPHGGVAVGDTKNPDRFVAFTAEEWVAFTKGWNDGEFARF